MAKKFVDISEFQGDIDWAKASKEVSHAYIRIGLRGSLKKTAPQDYGKIRFDKKWKRNLAAVQKYSIPFAPYYFPTACSYSEALEGAKWLYRQVKDLDMSMPIALDSENVWGKDHEAGRANSLSREDRTRLLKVVTDYIESKGLRIGIYASSSWLVNQLDMSAFPKSVRECTWVADYTAPVDYKGDYWLWQYGKATVAGISKDVDVDRIVRPLSFAKVNSKPTAVKTETKTEDPIDVAISIASAEVGYHEGANNKTKYGDTMHKIQPSNMDANAPWCDSFFDFVIYKTCQHFGKGAETARAVLCGDFDDYTYNSVNLYKKAGRWSKAPHKGDQIFFGGSGHTGLVYKVSGGIVYTIEGNKGDEVRKCSYSVNSPTIIGYGRPRYYLITGKRTAADMPLLKRGAKGADVKTLQNLLIKAGYSCGECGADGSFGADTEKAVKAYQKDHNLEVDGEAGKNTWGSLL